MFPTVFEFNIFIKLWFFNNKDRVNLLVAIFDDTETARFFSEEELVNKERVELIRVSIAILLLNPLFRSQGIIISAYMRMEMYSTNILFM